MVPPGGLPGRPPACTGTEGRCAGLQTFPRPPTVLGAAEAGDTGAGARVPSPQVMSFPLPPTRPSRGPRPAPAGRVSPLVARLACATLTTSVALVGLALPARAAWAQERGAERRAAERREEGNDNPRLRFEHLMQRRAWPRGEIPEGALQRAKQQYRTQWPGDLAKRRAIGTAWSLRREGPAVVAPGAGSAPSPFGAARWTPLGPSPIPTFGSGDAGRINTIAVHPTDPRTLYVGGAQGGVWQSIDGGATWSPLTDGECSLAMGSLVLDPADPRIVYAGTGEMNFSGDSYYGCGMLRSTDGGATWTRLGASLWDTPTGGATIAKVHVDPATAGATATATLLVASSMGLYRSTNGGAAWALVLGGFVTDLVADPTSGGAILYASVGAPSASGSNGIYKSIDRGATWTRLTNGLPATDVGRIALAHAGVAGTVIAAVQDGFGLGGNDGGLLGLWKTTDAGATWTRLAATGASCFTQCWYDIVVAIDPSNPSRVFFGGVALYRSLDGGASFTPVGGSVVHADQHAIVFDPRNPQVVYSGNDGGIYRSPDGGATWTSLNNNLELTQFYGGLSVSADLSRIMGGTQDNGTVEYRGSVEWPRILGGDGGFTAIHPLAPDTAWAETQWQPGNGFAGPRRRSTAGGGFQLMMNGITATDRALFIPPLVMDAARPSRLLFGTYRLYETRNSGQQWTAISPDLARVPGAGVISAIAPAPSNVDVVYAGTSDGLVRVTTNGGTTWATGSGLPNRYVEHLVVDPDDARRAWAAVSGFGTGHVWVTTDGGATWANASGNLPDVPVNALAFVATTGALYAGTDLGMFVAGNAGATASTGAGSTAWTPFNEGFPNVAVFALAYHAGSGTLVAGTHGRGTFARALEGVTVAVSITPAAPTTVVVGDTLALAASARDAGGAPMATSFTWTSSNPAVASIDGSGRVVARALGTVTVTARAAEGGSATRVVTTRPLAVTASADSLRFGALTDTVRLGALVQARDGSAIAGAVPEWTTTDTTIASVPAGTALVRALRNGTTLAIVRAGGLADTVPVRVRQVATRVAMPTLPDTMFTGERRPAGVDARDARGVAIGDARPTVTTSDAGVATVDAALQVTAVDRGATTLRATVDTVTVERRLVVTAPSTLVVSATPSGGTGAAGVAATTSARGTVLTFLRLVLRVDGGEPVELDSLGFDLTGRDRQAAVQLVVDADRDGVADATEVTPLATSAPVTLSGGTTRVRVRSIGRLQGGDSLAVFAQVVLGGGAPHGSDVTLALVPAETRTTAVRSRRADLLAQPAAPVAGSRRTTVLAADEALALSENPVRGDRVIMSFREAPRTAAIYTLTGRRVADLRRRLDGGLRVEWDLTNDQGALVAPGVYLVIFDVAGQVVRQKLFVTRGMAGREE